MAKPVLIMVNKTTAGTDVAGEPYTVVDVDQPQVSVLDLGVTRGDGMFEAMSVVDGKPQAIEAHLRRYQHSAELLDLFQPDVNVWREAIYRSIELHEPAHELMVKTIMTRGIEGGGSATGWVLCIGVDDFTKDRTEGVSVVTLSRGYPHDIAKTAPWLLQGAKTLSYAVNKSVYREAKRRGADDVIFTSTDGFVLEGPSSSVILLQGNRVITPKTDQGILAGTTQESVFEFFEGAGYETLYENVTVDRLADVDALWLVSSVRQAAIVHTLDGLAVPVERDLTDRLNEYLLGRSE